MLALQEIAMSMAAGWVSECEPGKFICLHNKSCVFDTALAFASHFVCKESFERRHSLVAVLANGKHRFIAASVHMPCWCSDEEFARATLELKTDIVQAKRKWKVKPVHVGMDANTSMRSDICDFGRVGPWSDSAPANGIQIELAHFAQELNLKFVNTFDPCSNPIFARDSLFGRHFDSTEFWTWSPDDGSAPKQYDFILANHDSEGVAFTTYNLDCNSDHRLVLSQFPQVVGKQMCFQKPYHSLKGWKPDCIEQSTQLANQIWKSLPIDFSVSQFQDVCQMQCASLLPPVRTRTRRKSLDSDKIRSATEKVDAAITAEEKPETLPRRTSRTEKEDGLEGHIPARAQQGPKHPRQSRI